MNSFELFPENFPTLFVTREKIREMDQIAIHEYKIPGIILMENAGSRASQIIVKHIQANLPIVLFCGKGNNGGDGFVIARHLYNWGIPVKIYFLGTLAQVSLDSDAGINLNILQKMGVIPIEIKNKEELLAQEGEIRKCQAVVDCIFGTGLKGEIQEPVFSILKQIQNWVQNWGKKVFAIDIPSGLDANTGEILGTALPAFLTITFGYPKIGFTIAQGPRIAGKIVVVDISLPRT